MHNCALLQEGDKGHEQVALQAVFVEVAGWAVGGGHEHGAVVEDGREERANNHGVGDIRHLVLVEAQLACLEHKLTRDHGHGVSMLLLLEPVQALVHVDHKVVEVHAALADMRGQLRVEEVHQEGLTAARPAPHVDALVVTVHAALLANFQLVIEPLQQFERSQLVRVLRDEPLLDHGVVLWQWAPRRCRCMPPPPRLRRDYGGQVAAALQEHWPGVRESQDSPL